MKQDPKKPGEAPEDTSDASQTEKKKDVNNSLLNMLMSVKQYPMDTRPAGEATAEEDKPVEPPKRRKDDPIQ